MDEELRDDVYSYLASERVNIEIMFVGTDETGLLVNIRLRPWKNSQNEGRMILAGGRTIDEALLTAVQAHTTNQWVNLNWVVRQLTVGIYKPLVIVGGTKTNARRATLRSELFQSGFDIDNTQDTQNEAQEAAQKHSGDNKKKA